MNTIYFDLETIPNQSPEYRAKVRENITAPAKYSKPESIAKWIEENGDTATDEQIAKTSFDPALGHICTIGYAIGDRQPEAMHAEKDNIASYATEDGEKVREIHKRFMAVGF